MNRAMFSGVSGMKAHQSKMDVIGNNIANVNTYGYKTQRAIFNDIFYQTIRSASAGTANRGGTNPSTIGYGSSLSAVQAQMTQSSMQNTGFGLDVAITGEGYLQVMDPDGNIFYTRAGMLDYDSNGYLTDINGNFVLGTSGAEGVPGSNKIRLDNIGAVTPAVPEAEDTINGVKYTLKATNADSAGNVSITFGSSKNLPATQKALATISNSGSIMIQLNEYEEFDNITELNDAINEAITEANGGKAHPGGNFTLSAVPDPFSDANGNSLKLTGAELAGTDFGVKLGSVSGWDKGAFGSMTFMKVNKDFSGTGAVKPGVDGTPPTPGDFSAKFIAANPTAIPPTEDAWEISMTVGTGATAKTYVTSVSSKTEGTSLLMKTVPATDEYIQVTNPGFDALTNFYTKTGGSVPVAANTVMDAFAGAGSLANRPNLDVTPSEKSKDLGLGTTFALKGGTVGDAVQLDELSSIAIASDGTVTVSHPDKGIVVAGRICLATFANPSGLMQEGTNYYSTTVNSGAARVAVPGTSGTGALKSSALEMSNVDLSGEFADMITTQRGFQANSRIITVSDTMLEELINLKR